MSSTLEDPPLHRQLRRLVVHRIGRIEGLYEASEKERGPKRGCYFLATPRATPKQHPSPIPLTTPVLHRLPTVVCRSSLALVSLPLPPWFPSTSPPSTPSRNPRRRIPSHCPLPRPGAIRHHLNLNLFSKHAKSLLSLMDAKLWEWKPARLTDAGVDGDIDVRIQLQGECVARGERVALLAPFILPPPTPLHRTAYSLRHGH